MKNITPIQFTNSSTLATMVRVTSIDDDFLTYARFSWWLFGENGCNVDTGIINCDGEDYLEWTGDNEFPYIFVAERLGLELIT
jgi:hypothetical protein